MTDSPAPFSRLSLGLWRLSDWDLPREALLQRLHACLDLGLTTFDHADIYGDYTCETLFGEALALEPALRDRMQLVTKCDIRLVSPNRPAHTFKHYDTSKAHILASVDRSLRNLHTEYIDTLLLHRPDPLMDADEVADAFSTLKKAGKVRSFGVSNFTPRQIELLASRLDEPLVTNQVEVSVLQLEPLHDGTLDQCQQLRMTPMAWSPFAGGTLFCSQSEQARRVRAALQAVGRELEEASMDQVALAWLLRHPSNMTVILGTGKLKRIHSAVAALEVSLDREQWFRIWAASAGTDVP